MSYIAPMGQANLIERLGTIPLPAPSYVTIIPTDDSYATDDTSISNVIRSQSDYITVMNPYNQLHSLMQNEFYQEISDTLASEYQYVIDNFNELKTLYNIDYYDGNVLAFLDKINNIAAEFGVSLPFSFIPYTNIENANGTTLVASANITKQNDFLRNIVRRIWLMRRWTGSLYGYKLPIKFINRIGAVHLGLQSIATGSLIDRVYRLIDPTQYSVIYPSSSTFPNSVNIPGAKSFNLVQNEYLYWDTQLTWDELVSGNAITWDSEVPITNAGKRLFIEISLERLITYINSINSNPSVCLLENIYLDTAADLLQYVNRVQDVINIGSQLSLLTSKDGYFNTYSSAATTPSLTYTHPNIQAKFQVFSNWNSSLLYTPGSYIKIGTGGFAKNGTNSNPVVILQSIATSGTLSTLTDTTQNWSVNWATYSIGVTIVAGTGSAHGATPAQKYTIASNTTTQLTFNTVPSSYVALDSTSVYQIIGTIDSNVFNSCGLNGSASSLPSQARVQLKDIQSPIFSSPLLSTSEVTSLGVFTLINHTIHSRNISSPASSLSYITNKVSATMSTAYTTCLLLPNSYLTPGSVQLGVHIDITVSAPTVTQTYPLTSNIVLSSLTSNIKNTYYYIVSITGTTAATSIQMTGATNSITPIPIAPGTTTLASVMSQIKTGLLSNSLYDWNVMVVGNKIVLSSTLQELHQKINIYEQYNPIQQTYNSVYKVLSLVTPSYQTPVIINSSGIGFSSISTNGYPYSFIFTLTSLSNLQNGQSFTINGVEIPVYYTDTYQSISERIALTEILNWNISWAAIPIIISNQVVGYTYTIYMSYANPYIELNNYSIFSGYTTDAQYEYFTPHTYMSTAQMQCMSLLPLFGIDQYPSLYNGLAGDYRIDDGSTTTLTDYTFNGVSGTTTGVTTGTNGYIPQGTYGITQGYSGITSYYYKYAGAGFSSIPNSATYNQNLPSLSPGITVAFSYNVSSLTAQSGSVIIAKQNAAKSGGWGIYYTYAAGIATLYLYSVSTGGVSTWSLVIPTVGWHRVLITLNAFFISINPSAFVYIDGIIKPFTSSLV